MIRVRFLTCSVSLSVSDLVRFLSVWRCFSLARSQAWKAPPDDDDLSESCHKQINSHLTWSVRDRGLAKTQEKLTQWSCKHDQCISKVWEMYLFKFQFKSTQCVTIIEFIRFQWTPLCEFGPWSRDLEDLIGSSSYRCLPVCKVWWSLLINCELLGKNRQTNKHRDRQMQLRQHAGQNFHFVKFQPAETLDDNFIISQALYLRWSSAGCVQ